MTALRFMTLQKATRCPPRMLAICIESGDSPGIGSTRAGNRPRTGSKLSGSRIRSKDWLGGLDSNQDSQIQSPESESTPPPDKPLKT
jgi:hypothetical protein